LPWVRREGTADDDAELVWKIGSEIGERREGFTSHRLKAGEHLQQNDGDRKDVDPRVEQT
jgi:hypothetical protein